MFGGLFNRKTNSNTTTTESNYADNRTVTDAGGGIVGDGNSQSASYWTDNSADLSQTTSNNWWDQSNRSTSNSYTDSSDRSLNSSNSYTDASDRSTNNSDNSNRSFQGTDNSNRSITYNNQTTDGGAFALVAGATDAQTAASKAIALRAFDSQDRNSIAAINAATKAQEQALSSVDFATARALGLAEKNTQAAYDSSAKALGFQMAGFGQLAELSSGIVKAATNQTAQASQQAQSAFKQAADQTTGNRTLILAALAAVAVVAFTSFRRG
jgi:hypothetical protein